MTHTQPQRLEGSRTCGEKGRGREDEEEKRTRTKESGTVFVEASLSHEAAARGGAVDVDKVTEGAKGGLAGFVGIFSCLERVRLISFIA